MKFSQKCFDAAKAAAGGKITEQDVLDAFKAIDDFRVGLQAKGMITGADARTRRYAADLAQRTRVAAAMQRRHTALNIIVRDKLERDVDSFLQQGITEGKALFAMLEGIKQGVAGSRKSVDALRGAYEQNFVGGMLGDLNREAPHLIKMLRDPEIDRMVAVEMHELRKGGNPGSTGNSDAVLIARTFAKWSEFARTELNRLGAGIAKLDGWSGPQLHDDMKMLEAGRDTWIGFVTAHLDTARTFPDGLSSAEVQKVLGDIFDTITTGVSKGETAAGRGSYRAPANMAKALGKHRVLHFKDAAASEAYRERFGFGNSVSAMVGHLRNAARVAANMDKFGPNPEVMFLSMAEHLKQRIRENPNYTPEERQRRIKEIGGDATILRASLRHALDIATGATDRADNFTMAKISFNLGAIQTMAKLGAALPTSITDPVTSALASQFRGNGFFRGFAQQLEYLTAGRTTDEAREALFLLGQGFDGIIGHIVHPLAAQDGPVGVMGGLQEFFLRANLLTPWTDWNRAGAAHMIASEMGMRSDTAYDQLPEAYRHVLSMQGIDAPRWAVIQQMPHLTDRGYKLITPDRVAAVPDAAFLPLVADRIAAANGNVERITAIISRARRDLELDLRRFFHDESRYAVITTDARSKRTMTWGTQSGTLVGEMMRRMMQFKGFPTAFIHRIGGRATLGYRRDARGDQAMHIGTLIVSLTMAGYAAMTIKDALKGYWPPRDPGDPRVWLAAMQQGGALGIYGDFLFSQSSRFGGSALETVAGPTIGTISDAFGIYSDALGYATTGGDDPFSQAQAFNLLISNTPFANLFYVKPAFDYLILNSFRETLSPGWQRRQMRNRQLEYGQDRLFPMQRN